LRFDEVAVHDLARESAICFRLKVLYAIRLSIARAVPAAILPDRASLLSLPALVYA
jgi:hypothetical protein